ncbi:MAG TPA: signal peptide peptidase SppA [Flavitalea sp.]|nr:signal peptide peptidase SppA [Flavitalea sp.]
MNNFFRTFFAVLLALTVFAVIALVVVIVSISSVARSKEAVTGENAVLVVDLSQHFPEVEQPDPVSALTDGDKTSPPSLYDLVRLIRHAGNNKAVKGIYVKCAGNDNDFASSLEIRNALLDFKKSGKFVLAYADAIPQKAYYVASVANKVYCAPTGGIDWHGFAMSMPFIKGTLEKLEIEPQIFYAGKFKSATEPLREKHMTEANRLQSTELLHDIYGQFLSEIGASRQIDTGTLHRYADSNTVAFSSAALSNKMVDGLRYDDQVKDEIRSAIKIDKHAKINFVSAGKYAEAEDFQRSGKEKIAVIYAEGTIVDGQGDRDKIGGETYRNHIRRARMDKTVKAIVLRINSGGGSAAASEQMWREVEIAKKVKPVVVSFGDVAASGGYYMACGADSIFAQPNTITGSIGVFGVIPNMQKFFNNKLGVTFDEVSTSPDGGMITVTKPLSPSQKMHIQNSIDTIYRLFKMHVAQGRNKPMEYIDSIAQGRVWSGDRAVEIGLVDKIGGIDNAIAAAANMAKIRDYRLKEYPGRQTIFQMIFGDNSETKKEAMIKNELGEEGYKTYSAVRKVKQFMGVIQTRMPYELIIE